MPYTNKALNKTYISYSNMIGFSRFYIDLLPKIIIFFPENVGYGTHGCNRIFFEFTKRKISISDIFQNFDCTLYDFVI